jgi:sterol desaturase/sphingolipid hydroxylase (fatty acid hydroxylase superfamily)
MIGSPTFVVTVGGLLILVALELRSPDFVRDTLGTRARLARGLCYVVVGVGLAGLLQLFGAHVSSRLPALLALELSLPVAVFACVMVGELINYWFHRLGHGPLWCVHFAHHVEERFSVFLGAQAHAGEVVLRGLVVGVSLALLGFSSAAVEIYLTFFVLGASYQHSAHDYSLGPLDMFIVSPAYHRVHHAKEKRGNYGATIVTWDLVFGTFVRPERAGELELGISGWTGPYGYWDEFRHPFRRTRQARARSTSS